MKMANIICLASAICFLSLFGLAYGEAKFNVEGVVYCDTCRVQFMTKVTTLIEGATVHLECFNRTGDVLTYTSPEAVTDAAGKYSIPVEGDHEDELCQVMLLKSPNPDCNEINKDPFVRESASVTLTNDNGIAGPAREANPLGFLKKEILPECPEVLRELGITPSGLVP
ncbi:olee1-like protein [Jatropha curcas]|uniref:olee1-like protein n=1 Tax=Jatropha curcas TaxID=180498 RepID=UPI0005FADACC|nr:olee1-like protein [Jatropha curcas]